MVREMCCTAAGSATMIDWNSDTGISSTSQRDSAMKSATTGRRSSAPFRRTCRRLSTDRATAACRRHRRGGDRPAQDDTEVGRFVALVHDRFVGFKRPDPRAVHQLFGSLGSEVFEQIDFFFDEACRVHEPPSSEVFPICR